MSYVSRAIVDVSIRGITVTEEYSNGRKTVKSVSPEELSEKFSGAISFQTSTLPFGTREYRRIGNMEFILLEVPEAIREVTFCGEGPFFVPMPRSAWMFAIRTNEDGVKRYIRGEVYALQEPIISTELSTSYCFPLSNTSNWICWGDVRLPEWRNLVGIASLPDLFFSSDFNLDLDGQNFNSSYYKGTRNLFYDLNGKTSFPNEILILPGNLKTRFDLFVNKNQP